MLQRAKHIGVFCNSNAGNGNALVLAKTVVEILQQKKKLFQFFLMTGLQHFMKLMKHGLLGAMVHLIILSTAILE